MWGAVVLQTLLMVSNLIGYIFYFPIIFWKFKILNHSFSLGFELMLQRESAHNIFRLLMCRDLDFDRLKGVIFDHSCGLDQYLLNREPREFEYLRCLVDGSHWSGHKRLRKPDRSGKGGHVGCSEGFNFNLYKPHLPYQTNSQGREQMHAILDKLVPSLRQMSYPVFMTTMKGKMEF